MRSAHQLKGILKLQWEFFRIFDALLHFYQEGNCFFPVDGAVIVTKRQIHHWADFHFAVHRHGARHDFVHAKDAALRKIQNWSGKERTIHTAICDCECAALEIFEFQFSIARPDCEFGNIALQIGKTFLIRVAHYRHHKSPFGSNRYADVVKVILDKIVTVDASIDDGHRLERFHRRLHEKRHQSE